MGGGATKKPPTFLWLYPRIHFNFALGGEGAFFSHQPVPNSSASSCGSSNDYDTCMLCGGDGLLCGMAVTMFCLIVRTGRRKRYIRYMTWPGPSSLLLVLGVPCLVVLQHECCKAWSTMREITGTTRSWKGCVPSTHCEPLVHSHYLLLICIGPARRRDTFEGTTV